MCKSSQHNFGKEKKNSAAVAPDLNVEILMLSIQTKIPHQAEDEGTTWLSNQKEILILWQHKWSNSISTFQVLSTWVLTHARQMLRQMLRNCRLLGRIWMKPDYLWLSLRCSRELHQTSSLSDHCLRKFTVWALTYVEIFKCKFLLLGAKSYWLNFMQHKYVY